MHHTKRLFLASSVDKVLHYLHDLAGIDPHQTSVAFVDIASQPYVGKYDLDWVIGDQKAFEDLGYQLTHIDIEKTEPDVLDAFDIIHLCGGSPLFLIKQLYRTQWFGAIKALVESGDLIITGTSAGSMVCSPSLKDIKDEKEDIDVYEQYLKDMHESEFTGLSLCDLQIIPHFNNPAFIPDNVRKINQTHYKYPLLFLNDDQAIWIEGDTFCLVNTKIL